MNRLTKSVNKNFSFIRTYTSAAATSNDPVVFGSRQRARIVTLNRPKALNALNLEMVQAMRQEYDKYMKDREINCVLLQGVGEKAFCAGGDVVGVHNVGTLAKKKETETKFPSEFFRTEYHTDYMIASLNKPTIAFIDGITMGGGVGISVHGTFRVATERSLFAMPETGIGLFPDVGGSYFLPRLPHKHFGRHLALTGERLKGGGKLKSAGIATHAVPSDQLPALKDELMNITEHVPESEIANILRKYDTLPAEPLANADVMQKIAHVFDVTSFDEYWTRLTDLRDNDGCEWAAKTIKTLEAMSPISVKVTFEQLRRGATRNLAECFQMEFIMVQRFLRENDFYEGVRAQLIDKDRNPQWSPASLDEITTEDVERYFTMDEDFDNLRLPHSKL